MREFMSKEEINKMIETPVNDLLDTLSDMLNDEINSREDISESKVTTIKYNGTLNNFYKSSDGYTTEDEAKFRFYKEKLEKIQLNIQSKHDDILREQEIRDNILKNHSDLFLKFSEEML